MPKYLNKHKGRLRYEVWKTLVTSVQLDEEAEAGTFLNLESYNFLVAISPNYVDQYVLLRVNLIFKKEKIVDFL